MRKHTTLKKKCIIVPRTKNTINKKEHTNLKNIITYGTPEKAYHSTEKSQVSSKNLAIPKENLMVNPRVQKYITN